MKLTRLDLLAFGLFTNQSLLFDSEAPGLHIVFGVNEAGKSTSLRALKALLYGFPERTTDNFQHANDQLLVGGCIKGEDGRELSFLRRKKRKADLLSPDGNPMDPGMLAAFLHGIDPALFESLYGIDHNILVKGGEDILGQKGEVGQALFAAGAGISSLKKISDKLDSDSDGLFKARGSKQDINQAIKNYNDLKKTVKEASLSSAKWQEHRKRKKDAEDEQARLEQESRQKSTEVKRLERLYKVIPELAKLENLKQQMRESGHVVVLPPEFADRLRQVEQDIRENRLKQDKDKSRLEELVAKREEISPNQAILDHAEAIEDLHQRLGEYRKGLKDRIRLDGMRIANRTNAGVLIKGIRPDLTIDDAGSLRPVLNRKRTIQALSSRHEAMSQQAIAAQNRTNEAKKELEEIARALSGVPVVRKSDAIARALKTARRAGDIDGQINDIAHWINAEKKACAANLKRLGLWAGKLHQLPALPLPLLETIRRFETQYIELENEKKQLKKDRSKAEKELKKAVADKRKTTYTGEVPTEQDLNASRQKRDQGWYLLRRKWMDCEDVSKEAAQYAGDQALPDAYEIQVKQADQIADRLRREADRVALAASLMAEIKRLEETIKDILQQEQESGSREQSLAAQWQELWKALKIKPLSPTEMLAWLNDIDRLRAGVSEITGREKELADKDTARQQYRNALSEALKALDENRDLPENELAPVLLLAEEVFEKIEKNRAAVERLTEKQAQAQRALDKSEKDLEDAKNAKTKWLADWSGAIAGLGLGGRVLPEEAMDILETISACFEKLEKAREFQSRIKGIDRDVTKFSEDVRMLVEQAAPGRKSLTPPDQADQAVLRLHTMLGKARQDNELIKENKAEAERLTAAIKNTEKTLASLDEQVAELLAAAGCDKASELADAILKSAEFRRLQEKISDAQATLAKMSDGVPVEDLKQQAKEVVVDELPGLIAELKRRIDDELYPGIKAASRIIGEEDRELRLMDGRGLAAEAAEKMERVAALIQRLVDRYIRIKLAAAVLKDEIERYREKHQDPVLKIASGFFAELTIGSFAGLRTDVDDKGASILVGVRQNDTRLAVEKMSAGTRDQLYLALRLATLESRLQNSEPMPFIVDDILINFDDARTRATLGVLAELAQKNQVILFTHHRQVVEESRNIKGKGLVRVHELDSD
ncbi:MAG: AAA family ATPase [Deltaproteobacteria bacterium]|nr:AAA family ATPase [Deltaproteobacteria bacterium]